MRLEDVPRFPCSRITKAPLVAGGFKAATNDQKQIESWQAQFPRALWGMPCGIAFDVLDLDGAAGLAWLREHEGALPETYTQITPRGRHLYLQVCPDLRPSVGKIAKGCDVRSKNSYVIAWGLEGLRTIERELAPWPHFILDVLRGGQSRTLSVPIPAVSGRAGAGRSATTLMLDGKRVGAPYGGESRIEAPPETSTVPSTGSIQNFSPDPTRNLRRRTERILQVVEQAERGTRNSKLFWASARFSEICAEGKLRRDVAQTLLLGSARLCGLLADDGIRSVAATIASGMRTKARLL